MTLPHFGRHLLGAVRSTPDDRDYSLADLGVLAVPLPASYSPLHSWTVLNQGTTPACVGFSGALNEQVRLEIASSEMAVFSGPDLYAYCKVNDGAPNSPGTSIRVAIDVLMRTGALVLSGDLPAGGRVKITAYARLNNATDIKTAILTYGSAWIVSDWPSSWFKPVNGVFPNADTIVGGHGWTIIGWDDSRGWLMQNSWGTNWGLGGRAWIGYATLNQVYWEAWRTITAVPPGPTPPTPPVPPTPTPGGEDMIPFRLTPTMTATLRASAGGPPATSLSSINPDIRLFDLATGAHIVPSQYQYQVEGEAVVGPGQVTPIYSTTLTEGLWLVSDKGKPVGLLAHDTVCSPTLPSGASMTLTERLILGRNPALWLALVAVALNVAVVVFGVGLSTQQIVALNAFAAAVIGILANSATPGTVPTFSLRR